MNKRIMIACVLFIFLLLYKKVSARNLKQGFKEWGFGTSFLSADLEDKKDLQEIPFLLRFGFDLRPILKNKSHHLLEFAIEPYSSWIVDPKSNFKMGSNFILRGGFHLNRLSPYLEAGLGFSYFTLQTREQATQFNFTETVGLGINYFLKDNLSLNLGYRYQHLSNASIKKPNKGIDSQGFILGISFYY
ncbi:MAG: acyloxyacyl hydrolase [Candidatus Omnitrophica bacterium]|nr:acyloxyacyl hydrolase [Candidatus Omnitrophota bacterium]